MNKKTSIVLPAKNEGEGLEQLLALVRKLHPNEELIVVNDGSTDATAEIARKYADKVIDHPYSMGNGAAIKNGARNASGERIVFMDADGQHDPHDIVRLLESMDQGFKMVVGARKPNDQANIFRKLANHLFNAVATVITGIKISDLTSGFRVVNADNFRQFMYLLPNGFSYPTTITMAFLRSGYPLTYIPIRTAKRFGNSKIQPLKDGTRFLLIILKIGSLFSPLRIFIPLSFAIFTTGICYYAYTYITMHRFTNMSAVLFLASLFVFLIGIIAEQISALHYQSADKSHVNPENLMMPEKRDETSAEDTAT